MKQIKTIAIKCDNEKTLDIDEMTELQGGQMVMVPEEKKSRETMKSKVVEK